MQPHTVLIARHRIFILYDSCDDPGYETFICKYHEIICPDA